MFNFQSQHFKCTLLSSCEESKVYSYPNKTISGDKQCEPESFKRRKCLPGCQPQAPYCHGRCVYGGRACFFSPCSRSPYREESGDTCSQLVIQATEEDCEEPCSNDLGTESAANQCQACLETNLIGVNASQCLELSGAKCWFCTKPISQKLELCAENSGTAMDKIQCVQEEQVSGCRQCVCTLLCYWAPGGDLCKACLHQPELATLFLNHDKCGPGWVYSEETSKPKCYKAITELKSWTSALRYCELSGGRLAEPKTTSMVHTVLEAINLQSTPGKYWLGGKEKKQGNKFKWVRANSAVNDDNWADGFPLTGFLCC